MIGKALVIVSLALSLAEGCEKGSGGGDPPFNQGPANVHCSVTADYPHWSSGNPNFIVGKVRVTCTGTIDSLKIEAKLQRKEKGEWFDLPSSQPLTSPPIAPVNAGEKYTYQADFPCSKVRKGNVFRTAGRASGTFGGKPAGSATWEYSPVMGKEVKCQRRRQYSAGGPSPTV